MPVGAPPSTDHSAARGRARPRSVLAVRREWEGVDIEDLIRDQLEPFVDHADVRLELSGPSLVLKPNGARIFGLVLHELATNASKYGALSTPTGRILVDWSVMIGPDAAAIFQMS